MAYNVITLFSRCNVVMNFLLVLFLCISGSTALATPKIDNNKKIIYCPERVECKDGRCVGVGNDKEYFKHAYLSSEPFQEGTYNFRGITYNAHTPYDTRCMYVTEYGPFKNYTSLIIKNGANFEPLNENWTKWQFFPNNPPVCYADLSNSCPLIEKREVFLDSKFREKNNKEEYDSYSRNILIELATKEGYSLSSSTSSGNLIPLDYEKTTDACGINKECKIYVQIRGLNRDGMPGQIMFLGIITITTGDIMRVVSITPSDTNLSLVMTTTPPMNNTIILHSKN